MTVPKNQLVRSSSIIALAAGLASLAVFAASAATFGENDREPNGSSFDAAPAVDVGDRERMDDGERPLGRSDPINGDVGGVPNGVGGSATPAENGYCGDFHFSEIATSVSDTRSSAPIRSFSSTSGCQVEVVVRLRDTATAIAGECHILPILTQPSQEFKGRQGASVLLQEFGEGCVALKSSSSITLPPPTVVLLPDPSGSVSGVMVTSAPLNVWTFHQIAGKITGQDPVNIDMLWNRTHLGWWEDGYTADSGSWSENDGVDALWQTTAAFTWYNTTQSNVNNYEVTHQRDFHSDGLPPPYKNVNAGTSMTLNGYYNGYATCGNFSHDYDSGAQWYFYLHWYSNECYWEA